jgi:dUTP pyrophosphatase
MMIEYFKTDRLVIAPSRSNPSDAGLDVYAFLEEPVEIAWGESAVIPTGLKFGIPHGYMIEVKNRSSVAAKKGLVVGACVIDSGYDGEVFINLHNIGRKTQKLYHGDKIAQLVMVPVIHFYPKEVMNDALYRHSITMSNRGDGALGSTDTVPVDSDQKRLRESFRGLTDLETYQHLRDSTIVRE